MNEGRKRKINLWLFLFALGLMHRKHIPQIRYSFSRGGPCSEIAVWMAFTPAIPV